MWRNQVCKVKPESARSASAIVFPLFSNSRHRRVANIALGVAHRQRHFPAIKCWVQSQIHGTQPCEGCRLRRVLLKGNYEANGQIKTSCIYSVAWMKYVSAHRPFFSSVRSDVSDWYQPWSVFCVFKYTSVRMQLLHCALSRIQQLQANIVIQGESCFWPPGCLVSSNSGMKNENPAPSPALHQRLASCWCTVFISLCLFCFFPSLKSIALWDWKAEAAAKLTMRAADYLLDNHPGHIIMFVLILKSVWLAERSKVVSF